ELVPPLTGDGTAPGISAVLTGALRDPAVNVVVTVGPIGSDLLARSGVPPKPAIAALVIDASWQGLAERAGASWLRHLAYVDRSYPVASTLADFHRLIPFRKLSVIIDREILKAIPQLQTGAAEVTRAAGAEAIVVAAGEQADEVLSALPAGVDAVYLTPLVA